MSKSPTVAVLGTGSIGTRHLNILRDLQVSSIAIPVRRQRRDELEAQGWTCAADLDEAYRNGARAVVIATETARHFSDVSVALGLGFAVLCEKPLASEASLAGDLMATSRSRQLPLFVACCLRFDSGFLRFKDFLPEMGDLHSARAECRSYLPDWRPGRDFRQGYAARGPRHGILLDLIHDVDYSCWFFGAPSSVRGHFVGTDRLGIEGAEAAFASWSTRSCPLVSLELDYITRVPVRFIRASGSEGEIAYNFIARSLIRTYPGREPILEPIPGERPDMYRAQMEVFLGAIDGRDPGALGTAGDGLVALQVCEAWKRSASSGGEELIP